MAKPTFKHQEDEGDLSVFTSGDTVLIACEHGHYWVIDAKQKTSETVKPALEDALPNDRAEELLKAL